MSTNILSASALAATFISLLLGISVQAHPPGESPPHGYPQGPPDGPPHGPPECKASEAEIRCLHIDLEIILKIALSDFIYSKPSLKEQAPGFDAFKHVSIPRGSFNNVCLYLLSDVVVRESITPCALGARNETYVPVSPVQMFRDLVAENAKVKSELY